MPPKCFISFHESTDSYILPERFTFPFYYEPHPLAMLAVKELQSQLEQINDWEHNFGLKEGKRGLVIGKMFGVLVVENQAKELGYLMAFSGKLFGKNEHDNFVPPVYETEGEDHFLNVGMPQLSQLSEDISVLENHPDYLAVNQQFEDDKKAQVDQIAAQKLKIKTGKKERKAQRQEAKSKLSAEAYQKLEAELIYKSQGDSIYLKNLTDHWKERLVESQQKLNTYLEPINDLKTARKNKSTALQQKLFDQYTFLNQAGVEKSLSQIFQTTAPISGAGECAAPKLLQYAFQHQLRPITMAEFWWGQSPSSEIRKHGLYYPACQGKCKPILAHMLEGIELDENPLLVNPALGKTIPIIYEDDHLLVINKPHEFLSVPGISIQDSVAWRMKIKYPEASGPLIVHRLDMSTSGLMLIAKSLKVHNFLQRQFIKRQVSKRYVAILDGIVKEDEGLIDLPLRVDIHDRPRQLVCYEHGKSAQTRYKVIDRSNGQTRIHFFPITGRSHQLRMHAAHPSGLNIPILGDDLYGTRAERMFLHAAFLEFMHPTTRKMMRIELEPKF